MRMKLLLLASLIAMYLLAYIGNQQACTVNNPKKSDN